MLGGREREDTGKNRIQWEVEASEETSSVATFIFLFLLLQLVGSKLTVVGGILGRGMAPMPPRSHSQRKCPIVARAVVLSCPVLTEPSRGLPSQQLRTQLPLPFPLGLMS